LAASLADFPSPPPEIRIIDHAAYPDVFDASGGGDVTGQGAFAVQTHKTTEDVMDALEAQLRAVQAQLSITAKRQQLIQGLMERCDALPSINPHTANKDGEDGRSKDKKKGKARTKPSGASSDDRPCGWSCVVLWDEQDVMDWDGQVPALPDAIAQSEQAAAGSNADGMGDEAGVEQARAEMGDWDWCDRPRKRCDRHGGWQKTAPVLLDREAEELVRDSTLSALRCFAVREWVVLISRTRD
jgi:COMPASS component SPP1